MTSDEIKFAVDKSLFSSRLGAQKKNQVSEVI